MDDYIWMQTSLLVRFSGLGDVWSVVLLSLSAFLSCVAGSSDHVQYIIASNLHSLSYPEVDAALSLWSQGYDQPSQVAPGLIIFLTGLGTPQEFR